MALKFISPGVFTQETDQSFLAQGVAGIGAVVIGRTAKGPAFVPVTVTNFESFVENFGPLDPEMQLPYAARNYLRNSSTLTVVRVLGHNDGGTIESGYEVGGVTAITDSGSNGKVLAVLHHSGAAANLTIEGVAGDLNSFVVRLGTSFAATASFLTSSANYIKKVLNTDPTKYDAYGHYLSEVYSYSKPAVSAVWSKVAVSGNLTDFRSNFSGGTTPWVKSQPVGGLDFNLFRFRTRAHGRVTNSEVKVLVANVKPSQSPLATPYGTFDVFVRRFDDTDQQPKILESFVGCTLDPTSPNYILRRIGNKEEAFDSSRRKFVTTGDWPAKSRHVIVELDETENFPPESLPWGHRGYRKLVFSSGATVPDLPLTRNQYDRNGNQDPNICWGISFVSGGIVDRMRAFPDNAVVDLDGEFSLGFLSSSYTNGRQVWSYNSSLGAASYHQPVMASASLYKFNLPFQGGFDGWDLTERDPLNLSNVDDETSLGVVSLKRAIDTIANPDAFDMNLLAIPGVHNRKVTDHARNMVNDRADVLYIMDVTGSSVSEAVGLLQARELDDNYTACYYPDLKLMDRANNRVVRVAPSVAVLGAMAYSDRTSQVFFAPAGLTRGGLGQFDVIDTSDRLDYRDRDELYNNRINAIATFPNEGINVWGQKTLQIKSSALDRINVRRLMIYAKKTVASAAKYLLFEPNNATTWQRFLNQVNPILEKIRQDQGIEKFKVVMDTTTNTADVIDRNTMVGKIFLQPIRSAEFIDLSFVITNDGVNFNE